jgi:hypothetical protein
VVYANRIFKESSKRMHYNLVKNVALLSFVSFFIKILVVGAQYQDCALVAIICSLIGYLEYSSEKSELKELKDKQDKLQHSIELNKKEIEELRSHVSTIKLGNQVRSVTTKF